MSAALDLAGALSAYLTEGFHVAPAVWTDAECEALCAAATRLPRIRAGSLAPVMQPHRLDEAFRLALAHPGVLCLVRGLLGPRVSAIQSQYFSCPPGTPGFSRHQDNYYVQAPPEAFVSAWVALEDADAGNGGLVVWPGTQREPLLPVREVAEHRRSATQDPNANRREALVPAGYGPRSLDVPRGAMVLLHGHTVHASHDNQSPRRWRRALLMTYVRSGSAFRRGGDAGRVEIPL
jgi:ectoine hydroxylase-related dioxygenase (phytanoyl-CoA dioxygenase family)